MEVWASARHLEIEGLVGCLEKEKEERDLRDSRMFFDVEK